jgi:hypothetical protein
VCVDVFNYSCGDQKTFCWSKQGQMQFLGVLGLRLEFVLGFELVSGLGARVRLRVRFRENWIMNGT